MEQNHKIGKQLMEHLLEGGGLILLIYFHQSGSGFFKSRWDFGMKLHPSVGFVKFLEEGPGSRSGFHRTSKGEPVVIAVLRLWSYEVS